jgi:prolyl 4-hydroxylase
MSARLHFTPQLRDWLLHNIDRGIPPAPLARNMVEQGFEAGLADALAHSFWAARATGTALPEDALEPNHIQAARYRYEPLRLAQGNTIEAVDHTIRVAMRAAQPGLAILDHLLDAEECEQLMALAVPRLRPSTIVDPMTGKDTASASRTSEGMFFRPQENPLLARIDARIAALMGMPLENGEGLQVLRYPAGTGSAPHFDFLMPNNPANAASIARSGQRVSTLVIYLIDVDQGGETVFPEAGVAVSPRKGSAVYFEYCNSAGQLDPLSLHAAAPVGTGEKWVATKWMRQRRFVPAR